MASRTQIRLEQLTGSLSAPESLGSEVALASLEAAHLGELLGEMGQAIARIHGEKDFTSKAAGVFSHSQSVFSGSLKSTSDALIEGNAAIFGASDLQGDITGSAGLKLAGAADLNGALDVQGAALFQSDFEAQGAITFSQATGASAASDPDVGISGHVNIAKDAKIVGALELTGNADLNGQLDVAQAVNLAASGVATDIRGTLSVDEAAVFDSTVQIDGAADLNAALDVSGAVSLAATGVATDIRGTLSVDEAAVFDSTIEVTGAADLNGALDVAGAVDLAATGVLTNVRGTLSVDEAATFDSNVTISGNLTVAGTSTTVNTETVTIADHNILLDSNNSTGAVINGAGITMEGGTGDDLTFQWSTADQDMELKLGSSFAKLHVGDLAAADAVFSADVSAVSGSFSGDMAITGDLTAAFADIAGEVQAASLKIDGDTAQRLYIVDADGSMKDEAKLVFDQTKLAVTGDEEVSGYLRAAKIEIDSASYYLDSNLSGVYNELNIVGQGGIAIQNGNDVYGLLQDDGSLNFKIQPNSGKNLQLAGPGSTAVATISDNLVQIAGNDKIQFNDAGEAIFSHANGRLGLISNGVEYQFPAADGAENYVLATDASGVLTWKSISAVSAATGKKINKKIATAIDTADGNGDYVYDYSGFTASEKAAISDADNTVLDVYLNGQLLVGYKNGTPIGPNADYDWNVAGEELLFAFPIEVDDTLTIVVR